MYEQLKMFEEATKDTLERWKNTPQQRQNAEENVKYAIIYALNNDFYRGFTSQGNARGKAIQLGKDGITFALLYNMIQLSDYMHRRKGETFGWIDSYIMSVSSHCDIGNIGELEDVFYTGLSEMAQEEQLLQQYRITDPEQREIQRSRLKEQRELRNSALQVSYQFADSILTGYVYYHTLYQTVQADTPVTNFYDQRSVANLTNYYTKPQPKITPQK